MPKRIKVTGESDSGRNQRFHDNFTGVDLTRAEFVLVRSSAGTTPNYHVRVVNDVKTPVRNPDGNPRNNLG